MGVDFGDTRTGIAVSDVSRFLASGLGYLSPGGIVKTADAVAEKARELGVVGVIVGLPINMNGTEGPRAARCREFADLLRERLPHIDVEMVDERLTTVSAHKILSENNVRGKKRKDTVDALSARLILEDYLTMRKRETQGE